MQIQIGKTRRAFLTNQPSKIPTTYRSYQAQTNMTISPGKVSDLMMKCFKREQMREIVHASWLERKWCSILWTQTFLLSSSSIMNYHNFIYILF